MAHVRQRKFGANRIANELREKGVADNLIAEALMTVKENELENAKHIWQKKYNEVPTSREDWARQARFLQSRGFSFEVINKVLANKSDDE
jgi:regulatory protein